MCYAIENVYVGERFDSGVFSKGDHSQTINSLLYNSLYLSVFCSIFMSIWIGVLVVLVEEHYYILPF